jgi:DNA-binding NtrC family response regulator
MEIRERSANMRLNGFSRLGSENQLRILLVEDNIEDAARLRRILEESTFSPKYALRLVNSLADGLHAAHAESYDVILLDLDLPDSQGLETVFRFNRQEPGCPVVVLAALADRRIASAAVPLWASDYFLKEDSSGLSLNRVISRSIEKYQRVASLFGGIGDRPVRLSPASADSAPKG